MNRIESIERAIHPLRRQLTEHPVYERLASIEDVRRFMELHVFAVWDFMSLLKALQRELTTVTTPWVPARDASLARFINEIVFDEESDVDADGVPHSHFELYLSAMRQTGASTDQIEAFIAHISNETAVAEALRRVEVPEPVWHFVNFTFDIIATGAPHQIAAAFTFGREDLIPDMFLEIVKSAEREDRNASYDKLTYYLKRHIELDGDEHGPLALRMVAQLCGSDAQKWEEASQVAQAALQHRIALWDGIAEALVTRREEWATG